MARDKDNVGVVDVGFNGRSWKKNAVKVAHFLYFLIDY